VLLPSADELPLLSPAALVGVTEVYGAGAGEAVAETPLNTAATLAAHGSQVKAGALAASAAVMTPPAASPFGASSNSPWGNAPRSSAVVTKPPSRAAMAPLPSLPTRPPESAGGQPAKRSGKFSPANPFAADAVAAPPAKKLHWAVIVGVLTAAVVVALVLAKVL
jgi:hypothetical protein